MSQRSLLVYLRWLALYLRVNASDKNSAKIDQLESFPSFWWVPKGIAYFYVNIIDTIMNKFAFVGNQSWLSKKTFNFIFSLPQCIGLPLLMLVTFQEEGGMLSPSRLSQTEALILKLQIHSMACERDRDLLHRPCSQAATELMLFSNWRTQS